MPAPPDYIDVAERLRDFRDQYPTGSLQRVDLQFVDFAGKSWVVYTAAAYRTPDDERPGHGTAWEPVPGPTAFTKDSELQNAETSAWGRALVAVLAADTKRGVASANEVRNRQQPEAVDLAPLEALIVTAEDVGLSKDWAKAREFAARSPAHLEKTLAKLRADIKGSPVVAEGDGKPPAPATGGTTGDDR
jgi:hypothetical protein